MFLDRTRLGHYILSIYSIVVFGGYIAAKYLIEGPFSVPGAYELLYIVFVIPLAAVLFGILSYSLIKRIFLPAFAFSLAFVVIHFLFYSTASFFSDVWLDLLLPGAIVFILSVLFSCITRSIIALFTMVFRRKAK